MIKYTIKLETEMLNYLIKYLVQRH